MKKFFLTLIFACFSLFAGDPNEVVNILKSKMGQSLKNPVMFARYGSGAFDWLAITSDGRFVAKLEGMNPDGTFRYTMLGDPTKYGIRLEVSLDEVKILPLSQTLDSKEVLTTIIDKATATSLSFFAHLFSSLPRDFTHKGILIQFNQLVKGARENTLREIQQCKSGYQEITTLSDTYYKVEYHNCRFDTNDVTANGILEMKLTSPKTILYNFKNLELIGTKEYLLINALVYQNLLPDGQVESSTSSISSFVVKEFDKTLIELKDFTINSNYQYPLTIVNFKGLARNSCVGEWAVLNTLTSVIKSSYETCPSSGKVRGKLSQEDISLVYNSDHSVDVLDNRSNTLVKNYSSCLVIPNCK